MSTLWTWRRHLNPLRDMGFAWRLWSHKIGRWSIPFALLLMLVGLVLMAPGHGWAAVTLAVVLVGLLSGVAGWGIALIRPDRGLPGMVALPVYFLMSNAAVVHALVRVLAGGSERIWEPTRRTRLPAGSARRGAE